MTAYVNACTISVAVCHPCVLGCLSRKCTDARQGLLTGSTYMRVPADYIPACHQLATPLALLWIVQFACSDPYTVLAERTGQRWLPKHQPFAEAAECACSAAAHYPCTRTSNSLLQQMQLLTAPAVTGLSCSLGP